MAGFASNVAAIHLGRMSPPASCNLPGRLIWKPIAGLITRHAVPIRSCSRWGLPCRRRCRRRGGLLPHPFTLTPSSLLPSFGQNGRRGGLLSVALSLGSPPPGVTRHRISVEPGLSSPAAFRHMTSAAARPTDSAYKGALHSERNKKAGLSPGFFKNSIFSAQNERI